MLNQKKREKSASSYIYLKSSNWFDRLEFTPIFELEFFSYQVSHADKERDIGEFVETDNLN